MDDHIFTVILDWLAFTVPQATVDEIGELLGGEWFETTPRVSVAIPPAG